MKSLDDHAPRYDVRDRLNFLNRVQVSLLLDRGWSQGQIVMLNEFRMSLGTDIIFPLDPKLIEQPVIVGGFIVWRDTTEQALYHRRSEYTLQCFCDGSGTSGKASGFGVAIKYPDGWLCFAENAGIGTNNTAELGAIWRALKAFPYLYQQLHIFSDSEYAIGSVTKDWVAQKNQDLINLIRFDLSLRGNRVTFEHVDGHAGVLGNEIADSLARVGRKWG